MLHMDKTLSPPTKPPRVSVPVSEEVLQVFQRLAAASGMSTGKAMAEWLADTLEAAEFMAQTLERARAAPKVVVREMHAYALGLADETGELMRQMAKKAEADRAGGRASGAPHASTGGQPVPPSCNTGGKLPEQEPPMPDALKDLMARSKAKGQGRMAPKSPKKGPQ
jgi:hypothetical protein